MYIAKTKRGGGGHFIFLHYTGTFVSNTKVDKK